MFGLIFWIFVLFLGLSYLGISVQEIINSPAGQANLAYLSDLLSRAIQWLTPYIDQVKAFLSSIKQPQP